MPKKSDASQKDSGQVPIPGMRQRRGRKRRAEILRAGRNLFAQYGFRGTSLAMLAQEVGMTDAGLLYHFPTKNDLLLAVLEETDEAQETRMAGDLDTANADYIASWAEFGQVLEDDPVLTALDVLMSAEHLQTSSDFNQYFRRRYDSFRNRLVRSFEAGRAAGVFRTDFDPQTEAVLMLATLDGLRLQWLLSDGRISMANAMRYFIRHMEARIRA
ncbi:MAG: TetR family transcriptional regulator [Phenylobacterium sp.]|uniref:TetR/AcrR family transcriptional regulator n=1 Tax=Phenylobacterium sp. TaxID=1871053 RepID=UPI0025FE7C24|nr:TetR/AcrR family transcriptional regulator [Phenylobacterium sp.]MBI1196945.1 TetR family transcriptional regulator [Phenylobacterium sp.]